MSATCPPPCRRVGIAPHSLLAQLNDDEPAVVAELVALVTELKADGGVVEVRGLRYQGIALAERVKLSRPAGTLSPRWQWRLTGPQQKLGSS